MAVEYMYLRIERAGYEPERMEATGLVAGEEMFARRDDQWPEDYNHRDPWARNFISRILSELGDDDWTLVLEVDVNSTKEHVFVLSRPR